MDTMTTQTGSLDTLASYEELKDAGIDERHAKALMRVFSRTASLPDISQLATKVDLDTAIKLQSAELTAKMAAGNAKTNWILIGAACLNIIFYGVTHFLK